MTAPVESTGRHILSSPAEEAYLHIVATVVDTVLAEKQVSEHLVDVEQFGYRICILWSVNRGARREGLGSGVTIKDKPGSKSRDWRTSNQECLFEAPPPARLPCFWVLTLERLAVKRTTSNSSPTRSKNWSTCGRFRTYTW